MDHASRKERAFTKVFGRWYMFHKMRNEAGSRVSGVHAEMKVSNVEVVFHEPKFKRVIEVQDKPWNRHILNLPIGAVTTTTQEKSKLSGNSVPSPSASISSTSTLVYYRC